MLLTDVTEVNEPHEGKRKNEAMWPVFQITWQRSRYVYDMHYVYKMISKEVLDYCIRNVSNAGNMNIASFRNGHFTYSLALSIFSTGPWGQTCDCRTFVMSYRLCTVSIQYTCL